MLIIHHWYNPTETDAFTLLTRFTLFGQMLSIFCVYNSVKHTFNFTLSVPEMVDDSDYYIGHKLIDFGSIYNAKERIKKHTL